MPLTRRVALLGGGAALGAWGARTFGPQNPTLDGAGLITPPSGDLVMNDASLLSPTPIIRHAVVTDSNRDTLASVLRAELARAKAENRPVNIGAARHSMGAQAIPRDGIAMSLNHAKVTLVGEGATYAALAGTRWRDVISALDPLGLSPKVMQSNHDFGVAATFSVNAHGWPAPLGPMGSTVRAITIMLSDGTVLEASRRENPEIFAAAMGGYGLMGLILDLKVETAPNLLLAPTFAELPAADFATAFITAADGRHPMIYGRLNVDRARFFEDALLVTYLPAEGDVPPVSGSGFMSKAARPIFRAQVGNEWVKRQRWGLEAGLAARMAGPASRNSLLNEPVATLDDGDPTRTDILHEYFVPPDRFDSFLDACRRIIPGSYQELLNVTLRWVAQDATSLLSYAPDGPRIASVLLFSQEMTTRAEADMARMTGELIDAVLAIGGSYYLPYRPHATPAQFLAAYPRSAEFVALKRQLDPAMRLRNALWDKYMAAI
jgi:FAD/FMN-containing dehydrogenase